MESKIENNLDQNIIELTIIIKMIESQLPDNSDEFKYDEAESSLCYISETLREMKMDVIDVQGELRVKTNKLRFFNKVLADDSFWK